jgi:pimeloyl-ACP methyl ester carboxylesterase
VTGDAAYTRSRAVVPHVKRTMRQLVAGGTKQVSDAELRRVDVAQAAAARLGWPLQVIDETGHVPHIEQPAAFLGALSDALQKKS